MENESTIAGLSAKRAIIKREIAELERDIRRPQSEVMTGKITKQEYSGDARCR
jgi:hypothetical protein